jgi:hypothetical protein
MNGGLERTAGAAPRSVIKLARKNANRQLKIRPAGM